MDKPDPNPTGRGRKISCRFCRDTPEWRRQLSEYAVRSGVTVSSLLVIQTCPRCRAKADITAAPRDWRRIKRDNRKACNQ